MARGVSTSVNPGAGELIAAFVVRIGRLTEGGIIDPTKVTRTALQNAGLR